VEVSKITPFLRLIREGRCLMQAKKKVVIKGVSFVPFSGLRIFKA